MAEPAPKKKNSFFSFVRNLFSFTKEKREGVVLRHHHGSPDIEVAVIASNQFDHENNFGNVSQAGSKSDAVNSTGSKNHSSTSSEPQKSVLLHHSTVSKSQKPRLGFHCSTSRGSSHPLLPPNSAERKYPAPALPSSSSSSSTHPLLPPNSAASENRAPALPLSTSSGQTHSVPPPNSTANYYRVPELHTFTSNGQTYSFPPPNSTASKHHVPELHTLTSNGQTYSFPPPNSTASKHHVPELHTLTSNGQTYSFPPPNSTASKHHVPELHTLTSNGQTYSFPPPNSTASKHHVPEIRCINFSGPTYSVPPPTSSDYVTVSETNIPVPPQRSRSIWQATSKTIPCISNELMNFSPDLPGVNVISTSKNAELSKSSPSKSKLEEISTLSCELVSPSIAQSCVDSGALAEPTETKKTSKEFDLQSLEFVHFSHCMQYVKLIQSVMHRTNQFCVRSLPESKFLEIVCNLCLTPLESVFVARKHLNESKHKENLKQNRRLTVVSPKISKCFWEYLRFRMDHEDLVCILCDVTLVWRNIGSWFEHFESKSHKLNVKQLQSSDFLNSKQNQVDVDKVASPDVESHDCTLQSCSSSPAKSANAPPSALCDTDNVCSAAAENAEISVSSFSSLIKTEFDYFKFKQFNHCVQLLEYLRETGDQINCFSFESNPYVEMKVFCKLCCKKMMSSSDAGKHILEKLHLFILRKKRSEDVFQPCVPVFPKENWKSLIESVTTRSFFCTLCNDKVAQKWFVGVKASDFIISLIAHFESPLHLEQLKLVLAQASSRKVLNFDVLEQDDPEFQSFLSALDFKINSTESTQNNSDIFSDVEGGKNSKLSPLCQDYFTFEVLNDPELESSGPAFDECKINPSTQNNSNIFSDVEGGKNSKLSPLCQDYFTFEVLNDPELESSGPAFDECKINPSTQNNSNIFSDVEGGKNSKLSPLCQDYFTFEVLNDPELESSGPAFDECKINPSTQNNSNIFSHVEGGKNSKLSPLCQDYFTFEVLNDPELESSGPAFDECKINPSTQNNSNIFSDEEGEKNSKLSPLRQDYFTIKVLNDPGLESSGPAVDECKINPSTQNNSNIFSDGEGDDNSTLSASCQEHSSAAVPNNPASESSGPAVDEFKLKLSTQNNSDIFSDVEKEITSKSPAPSDSCQIKSLFKFLRLQRYCHSQQFLGYLHSTGDQINCFSFESDLADQKMEVFCKLCNKKIKNCCVVRQHMKGKRHRQNLIIERSKGMYKSCSSVFSDKTLSCVSKDFSFFCTVCSKKLPLNWSKGIYASALIESWIEHIESQLHCIKLEQIDYSHRSGENFCSNGNRMVDKVLGRKTVSITTQHPKYATSTPTNEIIPKTPVPLNLFQDDSFEFEALQFDLTFHKEQYEDLSNEINYQINFFTIDIPKGSKQLNLLCKFCDQSMTVSKVKAHISDQNHLRNIADLSRLENQTTAQTEPPAENWTFLDFDASSQDYFCSLCEVKLQNSRNLWIEHFLSDAHCEKLQAWNNASNKKLEEEKTCGSSSPTVPPGNIKFDSQLALHSIHDDGNQLNSRLVDKPDNDQNNVNSNVKFQTNSSSQSSKISFISNNRYETIISQLKRERKWPNLNGIFKFIRIDEHYFTACRNLSRSQKHTLMLNSRFILIEEEKPNDVFCTACHCFSSVKNDVSSLANLVEHFKGSQHQTQSEYFGSAADFSKNIHLVTYDEDGNGFCHLCEKLLPQCRLDYIDSLLDHFDSPEHIDLMRRSISKDKVSQFQATVFLNQNSHGS